MRKNLIQLSFTLLLLGFTSLTTRAQILNPSTNNLTLQLQLGSQGVGADVRYGSGTGVAVRGGASFIPVKVNNVFSFSGFEGTTNASVKFSNIHMLVDYVPFHLIPAFRLVGGLGFLFQAKGGVDFIPSGNYKFGNYNVTAEDLGQLKIDASWQGFAPYVGIGLFKGVPGYRKFNINVDLGTYYLSSPKSTIVGTELLSENYRLEPQLNSNLKGYRWLPVLQVNFNFKLQ